MLFKKNNKFKVVRKNHQIIIYEKIKGPGVINEREMAIFRQKQIRGLMQPSYDGGKRITYLTSDGIPILSYIKKGITVNNFFLIMAQIAEMTKRMDYNGLSINKLILDFEYVFVNEQTREVHFIYHPTNDWNDQQSIRPFIDELVYFTRISMNEDTRILDQFLGSMQRSEGYHFSVMEQTILQLYPGIYNQFHRSKTGHSQMLQSKKKTTAKKQYQYQNGRDDESTALLNEDDEATTYLNESSEDDEATTYLNEDDEATTYLNEDEEATTYLNESSEDDEATTYLNESSEDDEATTYLNESSEDDEATTYLNESNEDDEATTYLNESSEDDEATTYLNESSEDDEATTYLNESSEDDEATTYLNESSEDDEATTYLNEDNEDDEATTYLYEDDEDTMPLNGAHRASPYSNGIGRSYLIRISTYEKIIINRQTFQIGTGRNHIDYYISGNMFVSRVHAALITNQNGTFLEDMDSKNGTFLHGRQLMSHQQVQLEDGDRFVLANEEFEFHIG